MSDDSSEDDNAKKYTQLGKYRMPNKNDYRQHAHCNPLSKISMGYPFSPECINWSLCYPKEFSLEENLTANSNLYLNTKTYPGPFTNEKYMPISTSNTPKDLYNSPHVSIVDVGCGYGALLENMSKSLENGSLALGLEIRDKVTNYVGERIKGLRLNTDNKEFNNISVMRSNTMKLLLNFFYKGQLDKLFFCFADPHFKRTNHRKRIINQYLLNEYAYLLKKGGKLYIITDVEELYIWERSMLNQNKCFKEMNKDEIEKDEFTGFMKNTNEARKVIKNDGKMYYSIYERVEPKNTNLSELYNCLEYTKDAKEEEN
jgi:tRNA (guanine-N7-)-methyltransferase